MNSEKDSYDKPLRKVTRILRQMNPRRRNNETRIRLDQPGSPSGGAGCTSNSPQWRVRRNKQSNSPNEKSNWPARRVNPNEQSNSPNGHKYKHIVLYPKSEFVQEANLSGTTTKTMQGAYELDQVPRDLRSWPTLHLMVSTRSKSAKSGSALKFLLIQTWKAANLAHESLHQDLRVQKGYILKPSGLKKRFTLQPPGSWTKVHPASGFLDKSPSSLRVHGRKSIQPPGSWTKVHPASGFWTKVHPASGFLDESPSSLRVELFHIPKYGRFSLSEIFHFLEGRSVPGTGPRVPFSGYLERSCIGDPGVWRNDTGVFFPNSLPLIARFRHRTRGITCALKSTRVAHSQQAPLRQDSASSVSLSWIPLKPELVLNPGKDRMHSASHQIIPDLRKMNSDLPSLPASLVGGRVRPRRLFADPFSSPATSHGEVPEADNEAILMILRASTRDDHRDRQSVDIGELESIDTQVIVSINSEARRKPFWSQPT
ncbi:hypothetical protein F2Q70_00003798 [Brassica cretica]|uniref:Uncharacterized protein n=1 Tax=Brassica cretica TaxID=69181 RepID=A0A8S9J2E0_BRACR|nr:hypothetical protein F2Q70_00003798 [Brassica cretica]